MITDETMGFGYLTYENEFQGPIEVTTTKDPATTTKTTTKDPNTDQTGLKQTKFKAKVSKEHIQTFVLFYIPKAYLTININFIYYISSTQNEC